MSLELLYPYIDAAWECLLHIILGGFSGAVIDKIAPYSDSESVPIVIGLASFQILLFIISIDVVKRLVSIVPTLVPGYSGVVSGAVLSSWAVMLTATGMKRRIQLITTFFDRSLNL